MREESIFPRRPNERPTEANAADLIQHRIEGISAWLIENAPNCRTEQRHLDEGATERAYWHYGYLVALRDIQKLLGNSKNLSN